ncbi:MAG: hypothetical protein CL866_06645 [Cycloclasticus sp.]|nr:hypothetical protein [Cycloclasticus sp.]MBG96533.1 hypothetical protein [Cycloclasticus sp.]HAI97277.1 hypothetical protein [Methylococcaceae bacterium]|tara:strand:- start:722 stop:1414 length:693 start_codon:yes stop_codon:yes gene_type:complete
MTPEDFKNISQGVQAIFIALAAGFGGLWAVFKLYSSKELDKSRAEAVKAKKEIELKQGLEGVIKVELGEASENGNVPVLVEVIIENKSSDTHTLDWDGYPLKIAKLDYDDDEISVNYRCTPISNLQYRSIAPTTAKAYWSAHTSTTLLPFSSHQMSFYWKCKAEGVYLISVTAPLPNSLAKYKEDSDLDKTIHKSKEKYENSLDNYVHEFRFVTTKIIQVPNKAFQRTDR